MPKRPGRKRGVNYDRHGRPLVGITSTQSMEPKPEKQAKEEVAEDEAQATQEDTDGEA